MIMDMGIKWTPTVEFQVLMTAIYHCYSTSFERYKVSVVRFVKLPPRWIKSGWPDEIKRWNRFEWLKREEEEAATWHPSGWLFRESSAEQMPPDKKKKKKNSPLDGEIEKARMIKSKLKCLLITLFVVKGLVHYELVPECQTINQHYYLDVLRRLREPVRQKRPEKWHQKNWLLHHDNSWPHTAVTVPLYLAINTELLYYPSHPILLTCSQRLFPLP
ncbi:hypothetical protein LAZ67_18001707 [Cordylochernes scorpioides]|uniref:Mariner Mos1 transposase n=1 Tax=Cordylochernes scorpioides TaxID=51811 RepID=A0ABY6LIR7_9ARAC|nr:hypothetical protein LAZ67_18001707 [Cordylochernes scorpioides]